MLPKEVINFDYTFYLNIKQLLVYNRSEHLPDLI